MRVFVLDAESGYPSDDELRRTEIGGGAFGTLDPSFYPLAEELLALQVPEASIGQEGKIEVLAGIMEDGQAVFFYMRSHTGRYHHENVRVYPAPGTDYMKEGVRQIIAAVLEKAEADLKQYGSAFKRTRRWRAQVRKLLPV